MDVPVKPWRKRRRRVIAMPASMALWGLLVTIAVTISASLGAIAAFLLPRVSLLDVQSLRSQTQRSLNLGQPGSQYRLTLTRPVNLLILGLDQGETRSEASSELNSIQFNGRSDTVLLLQLNPQSQSASLLAIPRDTQVQIPGVGWGKISQVNSVGGALLATEVVSELLGGLKIDRYVRLSTGAFRELVNLLDGVEVYVKQPMSYLDQTQNLRINLSPGWQTLNGQQAEEFVRFRNDEYGDIGRVQRQQLLISALQRRLTQPNILPRLPTIFRILQKYLNTNLTAEEMFGLLSFGVKLETEQLKMVMLPGRYSAAQEYPSSYWLVEESGRDRILRTYFHSTWMNTNWYNSARSVPAETSPHLLKIALQNATGKPEIPETVAQTLEQQGLTDLYFVKDWTETLHQTQIIVQKGDIQGAQQVQKALGFGKVEFTSTGDIDSDITIRIGRDWLR